MIKAQAKIQVMALKDYEAYAEYNLKIVSKDGEQVPFKHNSIQKSINNKVKELKAGGKPVRMLVLKARQEGVSTNEQGRMLFNTATRANRNALIMAHRDDATNTIFEKAKYMYNYLPASCKPLTRASNARELIFDVPLHYKGEKRGLNSKIRIQTASNEGVGRSDTFHYVHLSEFAYFEGDPKMILTGIMQSVPKTGETEVTIESTANGMNDFYFLWKDAVSGKNDWTPLFFAWHDFEEYKMLVTEKERHDIMSGLSEYEQMLVDAYSCTAEQIKWYRFVLKNDCNGDEDKMKQENPSFPEEAFLSTGRPVFRMETLNSRLKYLEKRYKNNNFDIGYIEYNGTTQKYQFIPDKNGTVKIFEHPQKGYPYVIGADIAEGLKDGDWSVSSVCDNTTGNQVAVQRMHCEPDIFALEQIKLARYYNEALIADEVNNHGLTTIKELQRQRYYFQYKREVYDEITREKQQKFGFQTTTATRPKLIDKIRSIVRDNPELINDPETINEMMTFIYDASGKETADVGCHDDCVIAFAIMHEGRGQQRTALPPKADLFSKSAEWIHPSILIDAEKNPQLKEYYKKKYEKNRMKLGGKT